MKIGIFYNYNAKFGECKHYCASASFTYMDATTKNNQITDNRSNCMDSFLTQKYRMLLAIQLLSRSGRLENLNFSNVKQAEIKLL